MGKTTDSYVYEVEILAATKLSYHSKPKLTYAASRASNIGVIDAIVCSR